jgi:hypothetical protein
MATFAGTPQQFMGSVVGGILDAATASLGASSTTYTLRTATDPALAMLVCDGNSWPVGSGVPPGSEAILNYVITANGLLQASQSSHLANVWRLVNTGTGSIQTPALTARFDTTVHPHFNARHRRNVVHVQEYINHRRVSGASHATALAAYLAYVALARSRGWEVLLSTIPPTGPSDVFFPGVGLDTSEMNTYLRAHVPELSPFPIVDVVAAGLDDPTDTALWNADQVHHNTAGAALYAQTLHDVAAAI